MEKLLLRISRFERELGPRLEPKITDSRSDFSRAAISSFLPGGGAGLLATGGAVFLWTALAKARPDTSLPPAAMAERGSIPFSTTASSTESIKSERLIMDFMAGDVSSCSRRGLTEPVISVADTSRDLIAVGSREGLSGQMRGG